jgi:hypothetical protein
MIPESFASKVKRLLGARNGPNTGEKKKSVCG